VSAALRVSALAKRYGELEALRGVSFELAQAELLAVIGPNGAGKTTLLSIIAGSQRPSAGSVTVAAGGVGWAPQRAALYSKLSVSENLELFARLEGLADPDAAVARMLAQTGLQERAREPVGNLSGGNRQRVNVALALIGEPPVLALDEPTASLDPGQRERLWDFVEGLLAGGTAVLYSTHNVGEVARHAHRVLVLDEGRPLFCDTPVALIEAAGERAGADLEHALVRFLEVQAQAGLGAEA
jgi:ABC-2 type transport system ATP-binding protein